MRVKTVCVRSVLLVACALVLVGATPLRADAGTLPDDGGARPPGSLPVTPPPELPPTPPLTDAGSPSSGDDASGCRCVAAARSVAADVALVSLVLLTLRRRRAARPLDAG